MIHFLDFDRTLFDTDAFVAHLLSRPEVESSLHELPEENLASILNKKCNEGSLTFSPGELTPFLYADAVELLRARGNKVVILTYGNPSLQKHKIESALTGIPDVSVLYTGDLRKGAFMKDRLASYGTESLHVDDSIVELESLASHCPDMKLYEMRRDGGDGDGRWPVVHTLAELP